MNPRRRPKCSCTDETAAGRTRPGGSCAWCRTNFPLSASRGISTARVEHPHSQLIALPIVPRRVREEVDNCWHYYDEKERCIFCDIIRQERDTGERMINENEQFVAFAPYAPRFPFEMWLLPKVHSS